MRVLITGGSSALGGIVLDHLAISHHDWEIHTIVDGEYDIPLIATAHEVDRDNELAMIDAFSGELFEVVIVTDLDTPTRSQILRECGLKCDRWVVASNAAVYSADTPTPWSVTDPIGGHEVWGDYGLNLSLAEQALVIDRPGTVFRSAYLLGPGVHYSREVKIWLDMIGGEPIAVPTRSQQIQLTDIGYLSQVIITATAGDVSAGIYNVAHYAPTTESYLAALAETVGIPIGDVSWGFTDNAETVNWPFRPCDFIIAPSRFEDTLGLSAPPTLVAALEVAWQAYEKAGILPSRSDQG